MNPERTAYRVLWAICLGHLINDMLQSLLTASYPTLKDNYQLTFSQIGLVTFTYQVTASLLQPLVGLAADRKPMPFSLPTGTLFTFAGLLLIARASSYGALLFGASVLGIGSSVFHPESSRVARMAAGSRPGLAQSLFQVGGNVGSALGPLAAALVVVRWGQTSLATFGSLALVSTAILGGVGVWYTRHGVTRLAAVRRAPRPATSSNLSPARVRMTMVVLVVLVVSKFAYLANITSYYTLYLMDRFGTSQGVAQTYLFVTSAAFAGGTMAGGVFGDRFGRKVVIWFSVLGVLPFTLALPYADLFWTGPIAVIIGFMLASAFPAIVVYAQELIPGRVGMVSGLFFGLSFGAGASAAALAGKLADATSIEHVYRLAGFIPALGAFAAFLPDLSDPAPVAAPRLVSKADS